VYLNDWADGHQVEVFMIMITVIAGGALAAWFAAVSIYGLRGPQRNGDVIAFLAMLLLGGLNGMVLSQILLVIIDCRKKRDGRR
jgi:formate hydrogenlyase subunit 3/multisubunit Na+/H+ antiporter MnhD subunit